MPNLRAGVLCALTGLLFVPNAAAVPIHGDSVSSFQAGPQNIADPNSPSASFGTPSNALGPPDGTIVSLGERGQITIEFGLPLTDGLGADLVVFENPFSFADESGDTFVFAEFGFVEVSTDGAIFARFPTFSPLEGPIGAFGVVFRRNAITMFMSVEIMLNAVNLTLIAYSRSLGQVDGQIFALFVMVVAAAEAAVGLALIVVLNRHRGTLDVDQADALKW